MCSKIKEKFVNLPSDAHIEHLLNRVDQNSIFFTGGNIGCQYVFEKKINHTLLMTSLIELLKEYPALAGRADFKKMRVLEYEKGIPFVIVDNHPGNIDRYSRAGCVQRNRTEFLLEPKRQLVEKGKAPLMGVKLTNFASNGCILGITINHALLDAKGFHLIVNRWSKIFKSILATGSYQSDMETKLIYDSRSLFTFGTNRGKKQLFQDMKSQMMPKPVKFKGLFGIVLKNLMLKILDKARRADRELIYFNKEQVSQIKETVTRESGEDWITTNEAVMAHILKIMSELQYDNKKLKKIQIVSAIDIRGRINRETIDKQTRFVGNAVFSYSFVAELEKNFHETSRGEVAAFLRKTFSGVQSKMLETKLNVVYDCLRLGYNYLGINFKIPILAVNNHSKLPVYEVDFGSGNPLRVIPQDVADNILFFPSRDGGMEIYLKDPINTKRQKKILTPEWRSKFYDF